LQEQFGGAVMKIDTLQNPWLSSVEQSKTQGPQTTVRHSEQNDKPAVFPEDSVEIRRPGIEEAHSEKIDALQRAIANGTYQVGATEIADAMLREWQG
jgi:anti-sigma28 factor (negative regulator of flagellin synthesis)